MSILLLGLDHAVAPMDVREACWLSAVQIRMLLKALKSPGENGSCTGAEAALHAIDEAVILSTCNRLEIYAIAEGAAAYPRLLSLFLHLQAQTGEDLASRLYHLRGQTAAEHLLHIAAGLPLDQFDGPLNQEQITGALALAHTARTGGPILSRLFRQAVQTGRRTRALIMDTYQCVLDSAAAHLLREHFAGSTDVRVLVVGTGRMAQLAAAVLRRQGVRSIACTDRTMARAEAFVQPNGGLHFPWYQMRAALAWADIVIAATSAQHPIIDAVDIASVLPQRQRDPLVLIDLGLPRNIQLPAAPPVVVVSYNLDRLRSLLNAMPIEWPQAQKVDQIVQEDATGFWNWLHVQQRPV